MSAEKSTNCINLFFQIWHPTVKIGDSQIKTTMNFDDEVEQTRHLCVRVFAGGYDSPQLTFFRNGIEILDRLIATNERFDAGKSQ